MHPIDWTLFIGSIAFVVWDGLRKGQDSATTSDYFLAGRKAPWWAMGLSIMATQASAITMIGTTGQGWAEGMSFIQFYFALPLAMLILSVTAVPLYHRLQVSTAYEYLGLRFDMKTRLLSATLFLILRGLSVGFVIYAPSLVLSRVFHVPLSWTILFMGGVAVFYTSIGGLSAVISTDVKQMGIMALGLGVALVSVTVRLPADVGLSGAVTLAREAGRATLVDWSWNPAEKYTMWSSLIGGLFLFLSYFGTDQSQVQRLLAGRSLKDVRGALLLNALAKIPFQFLVLSCGVLLFVFYLFHTTPLTFEPDIGGAAVESAEYKDVETRFLGLRQELRAEAHRVADGGDASEYRRLLRDSQALRDEARAIRGGPGDTNFVFLEFILTYLPVGIIGILLAAIFAAALSSIDSEFNSMATVAVLDLYPRLHRGTPDDATLLRVSRWATVLIGAGATTFALYAGRIGSVIEAVNRVGSYVYGSLLGAFILAIAVKKGNGHGAFWGLIAGMIVTAAAAQTDLAFLYLNTVGTVTVVVTGTVISLLTGGDRRDAGNPANA